MTVNMRCKRTIIAVAVVVCLLSPWRAFASAVPWPLERLQAAPAFQPATEFKEKDVQAVYFDGLPYHGQPTRVFAWYALPTLKPGQRCPAMVLVHGGGGTAFAAWVRLWTSRGYAAIAMDTCGAMPKGSYGKWERHELGGPPGWGGFESLEEPIEDQWTYHAVADVMLAHSLIRSFPEVDPERTGLTGISWGGYLTCITAGVDARFKFAVPVYGCGFLGDNSAWLEQFKQMGADKTGRWLALWDPSIYLSHAAMPMLWVTGTNDFAYPMDSLRKSYRLPKGSRTLCIRIRMPHGHGGAGENPEEIHTFADSFFESAPALPALVTQGRDGREVWAKFRSPEPLKQAELVFTKDLGKWQDRKWESLPAALDAATGETRTTLPDGVKVYYFNAITSSGLVVSSEHEEWVE